MTIRLRNYFFFTVKNSLVWLREYKIKTLLYQTNNPLLHIIYCLCQCYWLENSSDDYLLKLFEKKKKMCSEDALFMKKLNRFIKDNPLVKGKIYFYIFNFFFIMTQHCYQNMFRGLYSSICAHFVKKNISNPNFQYLIIFFFYFF